MKQSMRVITVSSKGQVVIPEEFREELKIKKGAHMIMIKDGDTIVMKREEDARDEFADLLKLADKSLKDVWDNKKDDIWKTYLEQ